MRDLLLGRPPHDVDIATSARPEEVSALFPDSREVGAAFGVVLVTHRGECVEVATFRSEGPYLDGRHPSSVHFTDEREDALRRDFTVNGLFLDPETDEVLDFVGGREDLEAGMLRAIGDPATRFREDHLRMLRAIRFAAQLGFAIDPETRAAIRDMAPRSERVAPERTRDELTRMLVGPAPGKALRLLHETGLLRVLLPEVAAMDGVEQPPEFHPEGDVLTHTLLLFEHMDSPSVELAFAALFHDIGKPPTMQHGPDRIRFPRHARVGSQMTDALCRRLRFSNASRETIVDLVDQHMKFADVRKMRESTLKRFLRTPGFRDHLELHRVDCLSSHRDMDHWEYIRDRLAELPVEDLRPAPLVTGNDLMDLGYDPGPDLGAELRKLEDLQLEGKIRTREDALERARKDLGGGD
ncbi:MAG: CCA tRNA nucleotidyltransferase [Gemmatimonadota bacterium]|nr:CCA tRNA nucleotidyltransferase [Gemmatimonadota bacterium]MDP6803053.1 CCA tRNA nucleotidyltransferase [Gemmatimonadota bacterium]MDP7032012.1 CCA tRNA nucleotidyltransferase [Gemmatimonadota bacterium]